MGGLNLLDLCFAGFFSWNQSVFSHPQILNSLSHISRACNREYIIQDPSRFGFILSAVAGYQLSCRLLNYPC